MAVAIEHAGRRFSNNTLWREFDRTSSLKRLATAWVAAPEFGVATLNQQAAEAGEKERVLERIDAERELETAFVALGSRRGVRATSSGRALATHQWIARGQPGAIWLAKRIAHEPDTTLAQAGAEVLSSYEKAGVDAILAHLEPIAPKDFSAELLDALGWAGAEDRPSAIARILSLIVRALTPPGSTPHTQVAAVRAARVIPADCAISFLRNRRGRGAHVDEEIGMLLSELI